MEESTGPSERAGLLRPGAIGAEDFCRGRGLAAVVLQDCEVMA